MGEPSPVDVCTPPPPEAEAMSMGDVCQQIQALEAQIIVHVSCGKEHSLAVCNKGKVFSWGAGSEGQLGTGEFKEQSLIPKKIDGLSALRIIQVTCGHYHSVALAQEQVFKPYAVAALKTIGVVYISCGDEHTAVLTQDGSVFTFGDDSAGQLGHRSSTQGAKAEAQFILTQNEWLRKSELPALPVFPLLVKRSNLVEDTLRKLSLVEDSVLKKQLLVQFEGELMGLDAGGVTLEFFLYVFEEMVNPQYGMFVYCDPASPMWFPTSSSVEKKKYFLFGVLCGLSLFNRIIAFIPFPLAIFKKLLDKKPSLEDLKELSPVVGKKDFVNKYVDYVFNKSVEVVYEEFKRGFYKVLDREILRFFQPQELMEVAIGNANYDWNKFEQNAVYWGMYTPSHPTIKMFWKVFHELTVAKKKGFLLFLTGSDRIPVMGMDCIKIKFNPHVSMSEDHIPEAQTCFHILILPQYSTIEKLREKLLLAIDNNRGFGKN
ncbi:E3 ISG15--protein ligase HERC5 [Chelonia mydas]|uniref:E3 ISG15--protein ligase HERC5 n=1 Tax=Chelonia mydas TaxID=8469 RepID=M7BME3_CHEMY|nr:E3 ISG15--protein ligase HERC5 [Chelonia mydas]